MEPPDTITAGDLLLRRWEPRWAEPLTAAVQESLTELKPFLPWAHDGYSVTDSHDFITMSAEGWQTGEAYNYAIFTTGGKAAGEELAGGIGLMTRMGPGVLEIGYWMRTRYAGRGHMTTAVEAITKVALSRPGIERAAIRYDVRNAASAAVAAKAGFREVRRIETETNVDVIRERTG